MSDMVSFDENFYGDESINHPVVNAISNPGFTYSEPKKQAKSAIHNILTLKGNHSVFNENDSKDRTETTPAIDTDAKEHHNEIGRWLTRNMKKGSKYLVNETKVFEESLDQHKYARLANSSYDYFNSKGKINVVHEGLQSSKHEYISGLKDFRVDEELSTIDNLVLHSSQTGETHISYRGTTDRPVSRTGQFFKDWKINGEIAGGSTHSERVKQADRQIDRVISKYGKKNFSVSGHSQGAHVSYEMGVKHDLTGHHYNPAINHKQVKMASKYAENESKQVIYKTATDFASPLAYHSGLKQSKTKVKIVNNVKEMDGLVETHSIDQFTPKPKSVVGDVVKAERRTLAGSIVKSVGHVLNVGIAAYDEVEDVKSDLDNDNTITEKVFDVGIDTAKNAEKFVVDNAILDAGAALSAETFFASDVVAFGVVMLNDYVVDHVAEGAKDLVREGEKMEKKVEHTLAKTVGKIGKSAKKEANKVGRWFKKLL